MREKNWAGMGIAMLMAASLTFSAAASTTEAITESVSEAEVEELKETAVVYFSGKGHTEAIAEQLAAVLQAPIYEIEPEVPYTDEDQEYTNDECRANKEQNDPDARPEIANDLDEIEAYETIYLGYPIWWGTAPRIIDTFLETYDLTEKNVYTFCTSGGSGIEKSISDLEALIPDLEIIDGNRFMTDADEADITEWVESLAGAETETENDTE